MVSPSRFKARRKEAPSQLFFYSTSVHVCRRGSVRRNTNCAEYNREKEGLLYQFEGGTASRCGSLDLDSVQQPSRFNCPAPTSLATAQFSFSLVIQTFRESYVGFSCLPAALVAPLFQRFAVSPPARTCFHQRDPGCGKIRVSKMIRTTAVISLDRSFRRTANISFHFSCPPAWRGTTAEIYGAYNVRNEPAEEPLTR